MHIFYYLNIRKFLFFILLYCILFQYTTCFSQTINNDIVPKITPINPEVASLIKYTDVPVNNYNGTTNYNVDIYTINEGDVSLPIKVSYFSNGLKVDEESSSIGLGWSILAGGVIQKFYDYNNHNEEKIIPRGINPVIDPNDENFYEVYQLENKYQNGCSYPDIQGNVKTVSNNTELLYHGYKHDIYMYNFAGINGKFIKDPDGNLINLDRSNILFSDLGSNGLKAISTDGTQYFFEVIGNTTTTRPTNAGEPCVALPGGTTDQTYTYYLSKIISPRNKVITFKYVENNIRTLPQLSEWYTISNMNNTNTHRSIALESTMKEYILDEIKSDNVKIKFYSSARLDISNGKKFDKIEIFHVDQAIPLKTINFQTSYFSGDLNFGDFTNPILPPCSFIQNNSSIDTKSKRLKLDQIQFKDSNLSVVESYSFDYFTSSLPYKTSLAKDLWGYFNGSNNKSLIPDVNDLGYFDSSIPAYFTSNGLPIPGPRNRKSNESFMKYGLLKRITQPTKGYTDLDYQINEFYNPGMSNQIIDTERYVQDIANGKVQATFEIPNIGYPNPATITTHVICTSPSYPCNNPVDFNSNNSNCYGYNNPNTATIPGADNRLYALIEKKDTNGIWNLVDDPYDRFNQEMINSGTGTCGFTKTLYLQPGTYRITANYPDNMSGILGGPWSFIKIKYKDVVPVTINSGYGAGLRIKSIKDYASNQIISKEKYFSYSIGKLMGKPNFTYLFNDFSRATQSFSSTSDGTYYNCAYGLGCTECTIKPEYRTIYSNPTIELSHSANGALVGYDEVIISYGLNNENGQEVLHYYNAFPGLFYYSNISSAISPTEKLRNGMLMEKIIKKKVNTTLLTTNIEKYTYKVSDVKLYWDFFPDYKPKVPCSGAGGAGGCVGINFENLFMNFKPIQVAKIKLKNKTSEDYYYDSNNVFLNKTMNTTNYEYNSIHQLINEKFLNSKNELIENKTYYPKELSNGFQQLQMQELILQNRIDVPIKNEKIQLGVITNQKEIKYGKNNNTQNLVLPIEIHTRKESGDINVTINKDRKITFDEYDSKGNILQYTPENSTPVSIIWGYNKTQPIAKIENAAYSQVSSYVANIQNLSDTGTEVNLIAALNTLRNSLPNAMVTTYTYIPLIGVSTITDPKGDSITYTYDSFGRLEFVKDKNGNILSENQYHYKN